MQVIPQDFQLPTKLIDAIKGRSWIVKVWDFLGSGEIGDFTVTATGTGASAVTDVDAAAQNGIIGIDTGTADDSLQSIQSKLAIKLEAGKQYWIGMKGSFSDATQSDILFGWAATDTTPIASAPADGIWFLKDDGAATWEADYTVGSSVTVLKDAIATLVSATVQRLAIYINVKTSGIADLAFYVDGVLKASANDVVVPANTVALRATLCHQAGEAAQKTSDIDNIFIAYQV